MPDIYLTPASISYLNQFLLVLLITAYLGKHFFLHGRQKASRQDTLLYIFFISVTLFSLLLFLDVSLLPSERLYVVYFQNTVLGILLISLIQFAYHFPALNKKQNMERRIAFIISAAYTVWEAGIAIRRFNLLRDGLVIFREPYMDQLVALEFAWVVFIFTRNAIQNWKLPAIRQFALIFLIPLGLAVLNYYRAFYEISTPFYHINVSIGILFTILFFAMTYLASQPERTSFIVKLSGAVLTSVLAVFGLVAWLVSPAYASQYSPSTVDQRTIRFIPNERGGYDAGEVPFHFEEDLGQMLDLAPINSLKQFDFDFPFFGQPYRKIFISADGAIGIGAEFTWRDFQYHFVNIPMIFPLLVDLDSYAAQNGGVFLRQESGRAIITYYKMPAQNHPDAKYTFQVILFPDGSFDFTYNGLPDMAFYVDDRPEATAWAIGVKPARAPQALVNFSNLPRQGGPEGLLQDEYRSFRIYLHRFLLPLALAVIVSSLLFLAGLYLVLNTGFIHPLNSLLKSVQAFNAGQREIIIPVQFNDEIGYLTESFNKLSSELNGLITDLEERVAARTSDLSAANGQLRKLSIAIEQSPSTIIITDTEARIEYVNPSFTHSTGYTFDEAKGRNPRILKSNLTPPKTYEHMWRTISSGQTWRGELANRRKNGEVFWEYTVIAPIYDNAGKMTHYAAVKEDVTDRVLAEQALIESEKQYRLLFDLESDAIFIIRNSDGQILEANSAASELYGFSHEELMNKRNTDISGEPEATQKATDTPVPSDKTMRIPLRWHRKKDNSLFPVGITARFITWKGEAVHIAAIRDITEQHRIEQELVHLAVTDELTSIPNRRRFLSQAEEIFSRSNQPPYALSIMMLDLDHFKNVNDQHGHAAGDRTLREVTDILKANLRPTDLLARIGGEEFAILLPRTFGAEAWQTAERLRQVISTTPIQLDGAVISLTTSIGLAELDGSVVNLDEFLRRADRALYNAKEHGRNRCILLKP